VEPEIVPAWQWGEGMRSRSRGRREPTGTHDQTVNGLHSQSRAHSELSADAEAPKPAVVESPRGDPPSAAAPVPTFRELYDQYFAFVWRCVANRGVHAAALDDVVQEVFIVVHRKLPEFEGRSSLRTWLAGIVRRVVSDYLHKRGNQAAGDIPLTREPATSASPAEQRTIDRSIRAARNGTRARPCRGRAIGVASRSCRTAGLR
jgi:hypothetical protein